MKRFRNILCVISPEEQYRYILERAITLAENNQAHLTVVDIAPAEGAQTASVDERLQALTNFTQTYQTRLTLQHQILSGTGFIEIVQAVLRNQHDLVIKPAENPGYVARLLGNDDIRLLRKCPCPVWLAKAEEKSNYTSIMAAIDFNLELSDSPDRKLNQKIIELAASLALSDFAALHFVHVWDTPGEITIRSWSDTPEETAASYIEGERIRHQRALDQVKEQLREQLGAETYDYLAPNFHLQRGNPATALPEAALHLNADLVVMGTVARTGIVGLFIGNTAEAVLNQLECAVLAIKPDGFVSPVSLE
jgi:universal stress protein E